MRKLGIALLALIVLVIAALLIAPAFMDANQYRGPIQAALEKHLGRPVTLGVLHARLLPPSVRAENVVIGEDPQFAAGDSGRPFATTQNLYVTLRLLPLLHKEVDVQALELDKPHIELIRNSAGVWNFASLGHSSVTLSEPAPVPGQKPQEQQAKQQVKQQAAQQAQQQSESFSLALLKVQDGQVGFTDEQKQQPRAVYDHIDLAVKGFEPGSSFGVTVAAHLPGHGAQTFQLDATLGPINDASMIETPLHGTVKLDQVSLSGLQEFMNAKALAGTDATFSGSVNLRSQSGKLQSDGLLKIENAKLNGVDVGYPISADYSAADDLNADTVRIDRGTLKLGDTPVTLTGSINTHLTPAQLDVHLTASNASIAEIAHLASAAGVAFNPKTKVNGNISADVFARGPSDKPALNGQVKLANVIVSGADLPKSVQAKAIDLTLTPDQIRSGDFTLSAGGTNLNTRFALAQYTSDSPVIDLALNAANASLGEVINIAQAYGVQAAEGLNGSGTLNLNVTAHGAIKNPDAMTFSGDGSLRNATLKTASLTKPLNVRNVALRFTQNSVVLQDLAASLGSMNAGGQLTLRNFSAPNIQFALTADKVSVAELQQITSPANPPAKKAGLLGEFGSVAYAAAPPAAKGGPLANVSGSGTINVGSILYDDLVLNNVKSTVNLDHGVVRMSPTTAEVDGGQESGSIVVDTRPTPATVQIASTLQKVDANKLISSVSSLKQTLYGLLAANAHTSFAIAPNAEQIARSLNGSLTIDLSNGKLAHMDVLHELAQVGRFLSTGQTAAQPFTNVVKLTGNFEVTNGLASTDNLQAVIDGGSLAASGTANLVDNTLNMHLTAVLSKEMSQRVGGTGIGGFMNTALANNQGELVLPVLVTGSFQHPSFAPDLQKMAQMKLQNLLPSFNNPGQLAGGIAGAILGNGSGQQQQGGLQGIFGAIVGQKQNRQSGQQPPATAQPPEQNQQALPQSDQTQEQNKKSNPLDLLNQMIQQQKPKKQDQQKQPPQ